MKFIFFCVIALSILAVAADAPAAADSTASAKAAHDAVGAISDAIDAMAHGTKPTAEAWTAMDGRIVHYEKQFGATPPGVHYTVMLRKQELSAAKHFGDQARYDALVQMLTHDPHPEMAAMLKLLATLQTQPLEIRYTAIDGRMVDLASMRGKVVLVDFWATWCPDCVAEAPDVVATYAQLHDKGFEIVGVSLDTSREKLLAYTTAHGMTWPQYFDGKRWDNAISTANGIDSIPAMWLVGRDGRVITLDASNDLVGQVQNALAAK